MYKIVGADNAEYGPVSAEKIREWIQQGRVNSQTRIKPEGTNDWKTLGELSEFSATFPTSPAPPPVLAAAAPAPERISALAIASLILGVLGLFSAGLTALIGLILGICAIVSISRSNGRRRGMGLAIAGTIVSGLFVLMLPIMAAMLLPALAKAKARAQTIQCMNNMKQLGLGEIMYASDNKDHFPSADHWCDAIGKYVNNPATFLCPAASPGSGCHYAFNARLSGVDSRQINSPSETVLLFEADGGWNVSGGPELALHHGRHNGNVGVVFADGHSEMLRQSRLQTVKWEP